MSSQPIRIAQRTLSTLRARSKESGVPLSRLAERYVEEGMRMDRHPGIVFRDGPAGRRPSLVSGPDVWQVVAALPSMPGKGDARIAALVERVGVTESEARTAIRYYSAFPEEIDAWIAANEAEAAELEALLEREQTLLG